MKFVDLKWNSHISTGFIVEMKTKNDLYFASKNLFNKKMLFYVHERNALSTIV